MRWLTIFCVASVACGGQIDPVPSLPADTDAAPQPAFADNRPLLIEAGTDDVGAPVARPLQAAFCGHLGQHCCYDPAAADIYVCWDGLECWRVGVETIIQGCYPADGGGPQWP
jgi:hypothetical protein